MTSPFGAECDPMTYASHREERIRLCITDDNASNSGLCAGAIADNSCISEPFITDCHGETVARAAREIYCRDNNNPTLCSNAISHFCDADPFDALCNPSVFANQRSGRVTECITGANANTARCTNAKTSDPCIREPFAVECASQTAARNARTTFCRTMPNDALCTGAVLHICGANPYDSLCNTQNFPTLTTARAAREARCIIGNNANNTTLCAGAIAQNRCIRTPFGAGCNTATDARNARESYCRVDVSGRSNDSLCRGAATHFCGDDPFDSLCTTTNFPTLTVARGTREAECIMGANANTARCTRAIASNPCIREPFAVECASQTAARNARTTFCRTLPNDALCTGAVANVCGANPYDSLCNAQNFPTLTAARAERESHCIRGNNANDTTLCAGAIAANPCVRNPYPSDNSCDSQTDARNARQAYCRIDVNGRSNETLCRGAATHFCGDDPFDSLCTTTNFPTLTSARATRLSHCITGNVSRTDNACANANTGTNGCLANPFDNACESNQDFNDIVNRARAERVEFCNSAGASSAYCTGANIPLVCNYDPFSGICNDTDVTNLANIRADKIAFCGGAVRSAGNYDGSCASLDASNLVTASGWAQSLSSATPLATTPSANGFVRATRDGLDDTGGSAITAQTLTLANATFNSVNLNGDALDGVAFARGEFGGNTYYYAGVLASADLGAPLTGANNKELTWNGQFSYILASGDAVDTDFTLTIGFGSAGERSLDTSVKAVDIASNDDYYFVLENATFDTQGIISGDIELARYPTGLTNPSNTETAGTLSGLIGAEGALGAFHSTGSTNPFAGGFVARRSVNYDDWVAAVNPDAMADTDTPRYQILQSANGTIDTTGMVNVDGETPFVAIRNLNTARFDFVPIGGDANDGYAWFEGFINNTVYTYVGILDTTNLGAPLDRASGVVLNWNGSIIDNRLDFTLRITFDGSGGGDLDSFVKTSSSASSTRHYLLDGEFNSSGVISGMVTLGNFANNDRSATPFADDTGTLSGLIGAEGAVGVWVSSRRTGGFVARPDIKRAVTFGHWLSSFTGGINSRASSDDNRFLGSGSGTISTVNTATAASGDTAPTPTYLNLSTATYNNQPLGGDSDSGVGFFSGFYTPDSGTDSTTRSFYAGVLINTHLGEPIARDSGTAMWQGQFRAEHGTDTNTNSDVILEIDFGDDSGDVEAFVKRDNDTGNTYHYHLNGAWDSDGVITGTVIYDTFSDIANRTRANTVSTGNDTAILRGLIGQDGALGVFISGTAVDNNGVLTGGTGDAGFVGGFVAQPSP